MQEHKLLRLVLSVLTSTLLACGSSTIATRDDTGGAIDCAAAGNDVCDGIDNDCDGEYDEDCACTDGAVQACGFAAGACVQGVQKCTAGVFGACEGVVGPKSEECDGIDNDCDGEIDEICICADGDTQACGSDVGECSAGSQTCSSEVWGACTGEKAGGAENCDGLDNDCDGTTDNVAPVSLGELGACAANVQICDNGTMVDDSANVAASAEQCDDIDNDCNGSTDEGCDDDGDGYCDDAFTTVGTPAVCSSGGGDCDDTESATNPGATETCDGNNNACSGSVPANEIDADGDLYVACTGWNDTQGDDPTILGGGDCDEDATTGPSINPGMPEICGDTTGVDENCAGGADDGCDDDGDGYCDANNAVAVDNPTVCPNSLTGRGDDCDDNPINGNLAFPGNTPEICADNLDNDCDGLADFQDTATCPYLSVTVVTVPNPLPIRHAAFRTVEVRATPNVATNWQVNITAACDPAGTCPQGCNQGDVSIYNPPWGGNYINNSRWWQAVDIGNNPALLDCRYILDISAQDTGQTTTSSDTIVVFMANPLPIPSVPGAFYDAARDTWVVRVGAGTTPSITVEAREPVINNPRENDTPYHFAWTEAAGQNDAGCPTGAPCTINNGANTFGTSSVTWSAAAAPGISSFTVDVTDDFGLNQITTVNVEVVVDTCVWVAQGGLGAVDGSTPADALASVHAALQQAAQSANTSACVIGTNVFTEPPGGGPLIVPASPNAPNLLGGYDAAGSPDPNQLPIIETDDPLGTTFEVGYAGSVQMLEFVNVDNSTGSAAMTIADASPTLSFAYVWAPPATDAVSINITDGNGIGATQPLIDNSFALTGGGRTTDGTAIRVTQTNGGSVNPEISRSMVHTGSLNAPTNLLNPDPVTRCEGMCRAIHVGTGASAYIHDNYLIMGYPAPNVRPATGIGIHLEGAVNVVVDNNLNINGSGRYAGGPQIPDWGAAIYLEQTDGVVISNNQRMNFFQVAGFQFAAGIADGSVDKDGTLTRGDSTNLSILDNGVVTAGLGEWAASFPGGFNGPESCVNGGNGQGPDITVSILLVGTQNVTIAGNGRPITAFFEGIFGGDSTLYWDDSTDRLPPSAIGLWLIDTDGVTVTGNEIRSGAVNVSSGCTQPNIDPAVIGYRDGLPPQPTLGAIAELGSRNTVFDGNGFACSTAPEVGGVLTTCYAVEINDPAAGTAPVFTNNVFAGVYGNTLVGLKQNGGAGVIAINNMFDVDVVPARSGTVYFKYAVDLNDIDPGGITLQNNIFYVHDSSPDDDPNEKVCIRDTNTGTGSHIASLDNSLFYIEANLPPTGTGASYIRVTDSVSSTDYDYNGVNAITGITSNSGNITGLPLLIEYNNNWQKSQARLTAGSPAVDAGLDAVAPPVDIEGTARPQGAAVDIGHDEL